MPPATSTPTDALPPAFASAGEDWTLTVGDNGVGKGAAATLDGSTGLGTVIVRALVKQLVAGLEIISAPEGLAVTVDNTKGVIQISGTASSADYERLLRTVVLRTPNGRQVSKLTLRVGLTDEQLARFAEPGVATKVARRDVPVAVASGALGATTVSATVWAATSR